MSMQFLSTHATRVEAALQAMLEQRQQRVPTKLWQAMQYSLMAGGKRIRPALMIESYLACGGDRIETIIPAAMSIECLHTYSLIHDDLPSMDNDDLRRGKPTCHKQFDEATAILAADALHSLSFELLASTPADSKQILELVLGMATAAGDHGMVGGQMMDIEAESNSVSTIPEVERIHIHKTGELIRYSCEAGALLAGAGSAQVEACSHYGKAVGLLFQIADDILDATGTRESLGKSAGKDAAQSKATYVSVLGLDAARTLAKDMCDIAQKSCLNLHNNGDNLKQLALYILERKQ